MAKSAGRGGRAAAGRMAAPNRQATPTGSSTPRSPASRSDGWRRLSLAAIAAEAGLPILRVYRNFRIEAGDPLRVFAADRRDGSRRAAAGRGRRAAARPAVRSPDAAIRRTSAVQARPRGAPPRIARRPGDSAVRSPSRCCARCGGCSKRPISPPTGCAALVAVKLTAAAYLATMRVWQHDDAPDLAQTMAALDGRLRRIERWLAPNRPLRRESARWPPPNFAALQKVS